MKPLFRWARVVALLFLMVALAVVINPIFATMAFAADDTTVSVLPFYKTFVEPILLAAVSAIVAGLLAYGASLLKAKVGIDIDADMRKRVQDAAMNVAGSLVAKAEGPIGNMKIDVRHPMVKEGVELLMAKVPDAVAGLGLTPEKVAEIIQGKLGILQASAPAKP